MCFRKTFVIDVDRMSLNFEITKKKLRPSEIFFSKTSIECDPFKLEKDIEKICTGKCSLKYARIEVYEIQGKYCAVNNELLWKLRVAEKFERCSSVKAKIVSMTDCTGNPSFSDEVHIDSEMSQVFLSFRKIMKKLPTLETLKVDPSKILYSVSSISDKYDGEPIVSALADFREDPETLKVVRYGKRLYSLENRKLWVCKQVSRIERKLDKISVKVKMDMDTSMLKYFTANESTTVQIDRSHSFSGLREIFLDFLQLDDTHN